MPVRRHAVIASSLVGLCVAPALLALVTEPSRADGTESVTAVGQVNMYPELHAYIADRLGEFDQIEAERRAVLDGMAEFVRTSLAERGRVELTFICTHNSRRSHMGQVWARTAAAHFGLDGVDTYSGGTEATAFNPRAVEAVRRAGFAVDVSTGGDNPVYQVRWGVSAVPMACFSKVYDAPPNPTEAFGAVMTCTQADEACPVVMGASARFGVAYVDPKARDGEADESAAYDERCRQIAREMLYVFERASRGAS